MQESYTQELKIETSEKVSSFQLDLIEEKVGSMPGIKLLKCTPEYIQLRYYPHLYDKTELIEIFKEMNIVPRPKKRIGFMKRILNTIAKENKKTFGNQRLDCCDLNKD